MRALMSLVALFAFCAPATAQLKIAQGPVEAPYSLTASDGKGLELVAIEGDAVVEGPIAFTELRLTFKNPHPRRIEGQFKMVLPDGAAISRFAMKIRGSWMEGEVVEKQAARRAYEDALHRRQDPALLEQDAGNTFRARVFPIEANERKELIISWSQELRDPSVAYRLPLKGLPSIERLALRMMSRIDGKAGTSSLGGTTSRYQVQQVDKSNWVPDRDWTINQPHGDALRHDNIALARVIVPGSTDHSYGIFAAKLAGVPREAIERARTILFQLECGQTPQSKAPTPDRRARLEAEDGMVQLSLFDGLTHPVLERLRRLDVTTITPIQALQILGEMVEETR